MALQPINIEQIQRTAQVLLSVLDSDAVSVPGNLVEGVTSGKSLLRGILQGNVVVCEQANEPPPIPEPEFEPELAGGE